MKAQISNRENVEYVLKDKDGNIKKIFQPNKLAIFLWKKFQLRMPQIPLLFGFKADKLVIPNLVTNAGFALAAGLLMGSGSPAAATYIAIGTGTTAAAVTDTALQTEISTNGGARAAGTASLVTTSVTNDTAQLAHTFTFTGSFAVTESGILNASSTGTLLTHQVFSAINVISGDTLAVTWKVQAH